MKIRCFPGDDLRLNGPSIGTIAARCATFVGLALSSAGFIWAPPVFAGDIPAMGLVLHYEADLDARDAGPFGNHGTWVGQEGYADGQFGQAFSLDGDSSFVWVPNSPSLDSAGDRAVSISVWMKPEVLIQEDYAVVVEKKDDIFATTSSEWALQYNAAEPRVNFTVRLADSSVVTVGTQDTLFVGNWYHLAAVYDAPELKLYLNGVLQSSRTTSGAAINDGDAALAVGAFESGGQARNEDEFRGLIDRVLVYDRALTDAEIQQLSAPCDLEVVMSGYPPSVDRGTTLRFDITAHNGCSTPKEVDQAVLDITGPATKTIPLFEGGPVTILPGDEAGLPVGIYVPPVAPVGTYTVTAIISNGGQTLDTDAFDIVVQ